MISFLCVHAHHGPILPRAFPYPRHHFRVGYGREPLIEEVQRKMTRFNIQDTLPTAHSAAKSMARERVRAMLVFP